jgi:hypothetical protein
MPAVGSFPRYADPISGVGRTGTFKFDPDCKATGYRHLGPQRASNPLPGTEVKISRFEMKEAYNGATGEKVDVSELTLTSTKTNQSVVLLFNKVTDISALLK